VSEERVRAEVIRYWWDKATQSIHAARREADAGDYAFAINRVCYALFYAVSALLMEEGRRFTKHSGVRAAFNREIIRAGHGAVADREACHILARALSAPPSLRGPGVIARHEAMCQPGGDRAAAGRVVPASPSECHEGLLPTDERPAGDAAGDHRHRHRGTGWCRIALRSPPCS
jgi:uncharacterized protein (UPF0332 family)